MKRLKELYLDGKTDDFIEAALNGDSDLFKSLAYILKGEPDKAKEHLINIRKEELNGEEKSFLGLIYTLLNEFKKAEEVFKECMDNEWCLLRYGNLKLLLGDTQKAKEYLEKGLKKAEKAEGYNNLGFVYKLLDDKEKALDAYIRAWELKPYDLGISEKAIELLKELNKYDEFKKSIENDEEKLIIKALLDYSEGNVDEAIKELIRVVKKDEENEILRKVIKELLLKEERYWVLGNLLIEWVEKFNKTDEKLALIYCRIKAGFLEKAKEGLDEIKDEVKNDKLEYEILMSEYYEENKEFDKAKEILVELYEKYPENIRVVQNLVNIYKKLGMIDEALEIIDKKNKISPGLLINKLDMKKKLDKDEIKRLEVFIKENMDEEKKANIHFGLAEAYEKIKDYEKAAYHIKEANELTYKKLDYKIEDFTKEVDILIKAYSKEWVEGKQVDVEFDKRPIFIVGMPRSGTTMLEQIFAAHDDVFGAGELPFIQKVIKLSENLTDENYPFSFIYSPKRLLADGGAYYIKLTKDLYKFNEPIFVDKLPHNFLHSPLLVAMFKNSRVIALRRDYRSIALSNYFQNFAAKRGTLGYSFDLKAMGYHLKDYVRIMKYYKEILPSDRYQEFWYEDLVLNPKEMIPKVLEFCGLEFTEKVLEFYKNKTAIETASVLQVRNPIYTKSIDKWKNYEELLKPVIEIVGNEGVYNG